MNLTSTRFNSTLLEYLTDNHMQRIHSAALEILEDTGTIVHHEKAVELLHAAGAYVKDGKRVFLPAGMVEAAIRNAPSRTAVYDRNGNPAMLLEGKNVYYGTGSDCPYLLDSNTGERREFLSGDVEDAVRLVDALPYIDFVMCMGLAPDIPTQVQYQQKYAHMIRNSAKPQVITAANKTSLNDIIEIAAAVVGGREELSRKPLFVLYDEPTGQSTRPGPRQAPRPWGSGPRRKLNISSKGIHLNRWTPKLMRKSKIF
jgi:trimethylamine--corrinoid protein Co-methyltransferase